MYCAYTCIVYQKKKRERETINLRDRDGAGQNQGIQRVMPRKNWRKVREKENDIIVENINGHAHVEGKS